MKKQTLLQIAKARSFEDIYEQIADLKLHRDTIQKDIMNLRAKRDELDSEINLNNRIAAAKRKAIIEKK